MPHQFRVRARAREQAKVTVRSLLHRRNLDLVANPFPRRIATTLGWLGADVVLDIGANVGQYGAALRSAGYRGAIVSCEPLPDAYQRLARRATGDQRWTTLRTAVGAEPGAITINVAANSYSSSALPMLDAHSAADPDSAYVSTVDAPVTTVAALVAEHAVDPGRALLKIDTQGYESAVLDGVGAELLSRFAAVQLELSTVALYAGQALDAELIERLAGAGKALFGIDAGFSDPRTGRMLQYDGLFVDRARL